LARKAVLEPKKDRRIYLVCGAARLVSLDTLVTFIRYQLQCDPFDGNMHVFCNREGTHLKWLEWDGSGFCVGSRHTEWGRYPWPDEKMGVAIEINEQEFEFLLRESANESKV
jgi:transposase